jgi:hypothetical protein
LTAAAAELRRTLNLAGTIMQRRIRSRKHIATSVHPLKPSQNAQRNYERYLELARAEALNGDSVAAENYLQHAEHYLRSMHEGTADGSQRSR